MIESTLRYLLPIYFVLFFAIAFFWRSYVVKKATGINPYVFGRSDSAYDFIGFGFRLTLFLNFVAIAFYSLLSEFYEYIGPLQWLETDVLRISGLVLMSGALTFIAAAQANMGNSWRVGIDNENKTELVRTGFFKFSRNPIFLGMRFTGLGLFLALPNAITFATFLVGDLMMQVQVRLEEEFLEGVHGEHYTNYKRSVRRWL